VSLEIIGPHPFEQDEHGAQKVRIGTLFPEQNVLYTQIPGVHAWQRASFIDLVNSRRAAKGLSPLNFEEEQRLAGESVDLIFEPDYLLIRPDPERMDLAFVGDELLQGLVSKLKIRFLSVSDRRVREAIKRRGENWRLSGIPKSKESKQSLIQTSRVGIYGHPIYYYNRLTGTRWLTFQEFKGLARLEDVPLAKHLQEIADHALRHNRLNRPEVDFFAADLRRFGPREFSGVVYEQMAAAELRAKYVDLLEHFRSAVHEAYRRDDFENKPWRDRMLSTLFLEGNETQAEQVLSGLSPEFFMQVEWLPGGRFEEGEFIFDPLFEEAAGNPSDAELQHLTDPRAKGIILNFIRDYGDIEFINVGVVPESLSLDRPQTRGRRGVYLVEVLSRRESQPIKRFLRLQKWGVWEHLDEGKGLLQAIEESDEYTDYWLDRRLGCRQLGMNLSRRVVMRRLIEPYQGTNQRYQGKPIRTTYFERDYAPGIATDKLAMDKYAMPGYARTLAEMLGHAAASSMIVGRSLDFGTRPVFDDGDEVVIEGDDGLPREILVCDHSGAFGEYKQPLTTWAAHYARPVNVRDKALSEPRAFAQSYLAAFRDQFVHIQGDYRKRRRAFDTLFKHTVYDPGGSFAYRWECTLKRLDQTNVDELMETIRQKIVVLAAARPAPSPVGAK
jgi:hypothetical protein